MSFDTPVAGMEDEASRPTTPPNIGRSLGITTSLLAERWRVGLRTMRNWL